jgi:hypothetical protein
VADLVGAFLCACGEKSNQLRRPPIFQYGKLSE